MSNVPAVLILKPFITNLPEPGRAWQIVAMSSTFAGNLTLIGSVANLVVAERAKQASFLALWADRPAVDAGEPRVWHLVALVKTFSQPAARQRSDRLLIPVQAVNHGSRLCEHFSSA